MNEVHEAEKKQAEPFLYPYQIALQTLERIQERNQNAYDYIESILDDRFGKAGVALMPRILLINTTAQL